MAFLDPGNAAPVPSLPDELYGLVFAYLAPSDVVRLAPTCRTFHELATEGAAWQRRLDDAVQLAVHLTVSGNGNAERCAIGRSCCFTGSPQLEPALVPPGLHKMPPKIPWRAPGFFVGPWALGPRAGSSDRLLGIPAARASSSSPRGFLPARAGCSFPPKAEQGKAKQKEEKPKRAERKPKERRMQM